MLEIVLAGGWLMAPIVLCSVLSATIIFNRAWMLRRRRVMPAGITHPQPEPVPRPQEFHYRGSGGVEVSELCIHIDPTALRCDRPVSVC